MSQAYATQRTWTGAERVGAEYKLKMCVVSGDLQILVDAPYFGDPEPRPEDATFGSSSEYGEEVEDIGLRHEMLGQHECVAIFIASGIDNQHPEECEYIEILLGPHGHYCLTGYAHQGDENMDTKMAFDQAPTMEIDRKAGRWTGKASLPFYYLPAPGDDPADPLALIWALNFCGLHDKKDEADGREYISLVRLPGQFPNLHQLRYFAPLVLSDASSQRLRSISRASVSAKSVAVHELAVDASFSPSQFLELNDAGFVGISCLAADAAGVDEATVTERFRAKYEEETTEQMARMMPQKYFKSICAQNMQPGETIVMCGKYWKRKGWSHRRCILLLTTRGSLLYFDSQAPFTFRGRIKWKMTRPVRPMKTTDVRFDIELADCSRTYHFYDEEGYGVDKWMDVISCVNSSRRKYLRENLGEYDADVLEAMALRERRKKAATAVCLLL